MMAAFLLKAPRQDEHNGRRRKKKKTHQSTWNVFKKAHLPQIKRFATVPITLVRAGNNQPEVARTWVRMRTQARVTPRGNNLSVVVVVGGG